MTPFDIGQIDDVIHGRLRLGVMAYLASAETADFNELKAQLHATQAQQQRGHVQSLPTLAMTASNRASSVSVRCA